MAASVSLVAKPGEGALDGELCAPRDVAVAPDGTYFVVGRHCVWHLARDGTVLATIATDLLNDGCGIAVDQRGAVFVTDSEGNCIHRIARDGGGRWAMSTVVAAGLYRPWGIAVDRDNYWLEEACGRC